MYHTTLLLKTIHHRHTLVAIGVVNHKLHIGALLARVVDADAYSAYLLVALNGLVLLYRHRAKVGIDGDIDYVRLPLTVMEDDHKAVLLNEMRKVGLDV